MNLSALVAIGLTPLQAETYALLIEAGPLKPPSIAKRLGATRSNAYKVLDRLVQLRLAIKIEDGATVSYAAASPTALAGLTAQYRAEATAREEAAKQAIHGLLAKYRQRNEQPDVKVVSGRQAVAAAYRQQINYNEDICFIRSRSDITTMGFDTMHDIRVTPSRLGKQRSAIMDAPERGPINYAQHKRSNLDITWAEPGTYKAPVEWSVTKSSLLIVSFGIEPHAVLITDPLIAGAFMQIWHVLQGFLATQETHLALRPQDAI